MLAPSLQLARQVFEELTKILTEISFPELMRFRPLHEKILEVMRSLLVSSLKPTEEMIRHLIDIELGHINRNHPDFLNNSSVLSELLQGTDNEKNSDPSKADKKNTKDTKNQAAE